MLFDQLRSLKQTLNNLIVDSFMLKDSQSSIAIKSCSRRKIKFYSSGPKFLRIFSDNANGLVIKSLRLIFYHSSYLKHCFIKLSQVDVQGVLRAIQAALPRKGSQRVAQIRFKDRYDGRPDEDPRGQGLCLYYFKGGGLVWHCYLSSCRERTHKVLYTFVYTDKQSNVYCDNRAF